jgi:transcription elongation factor Elf1
MRGFLLHAANVLPERADEISTGIGPGLSQGDDGMNDCIVFDDAGVSYKMQINKGSQAIGAYDDETDEAKHRRIQAFDHADGKQYLYAHFMDRSVSKSEIAQAILEHSPNAYVK